MGTSAAQTPTDSAAITSASGRTGCLYHGELMVIFGLYLV